jgi:hypothetical protein
MLSNILSPNVRLLFPPLLPLQLSWILWALADRDSRRQLLFFASTDTGGPIERPQLFKDPGVFFQLPHPTNRRHFIPSLAPNQKRTMRIVHAGAPLANANAART